MNERDEWYLQEVAPHQSALLAWLRSRYPSIRDCEDIAQDALLRVYTASQQGEVRSPKSFLFTTARNLAIDKFRRKKQRPTISLAEFDQTDVPDGRPTAFESVARDEELDLLTAAIQSLPGKCRRIFTLRKVYGMSQKSVAATLGLSVNTVSAQLSIGLRKCRRYLKEQLKTKPKARSLECANESLR